MKKFSIFLAKTEYLYFLLLGLLIGIIVFSQVDNVNEMMPRIDNLYAAIVIFSVGFVQVIAKSLFYTDEESKEHEINRNIAYSGFLRRDKYFPVKINTKLSFTKRACGYTYVIMARLTGITCAYFLCVIMCGLATK